MALGRGLGALIAPTASGKIDRGAGNDPHKVWQVPVASVVPSTSQPRTHFDENALQELAESIRHFGVLEPLLVIENNTGGYELVAGERRWRASKIAGLATVPVIVKQFADQEKLEVALIENIQRENLSPIEEAHAYRRLIDEFGLTQEEVSVKVGKSRSAVANMVRLLDLPEQVQEALVSGKINTGQARAMLGIKDARAQLDMLSSMQGTKITVRELEREVGAKRPDKQALRRDPNIVHLEDTLRSALGTKVTLTEKLGRGAIAIHYYSREELKRLVDLLTE